MTLTLDLELVDRKLLNLLQTSFPLVPEPFRETGEMLGISEEEALGRVRRLKQRHIIRDINAIFDTRRLGYRSCLVAMSFTPERLHQGALSINRHPGVSHNYAREGSYYNLWFTLAVLPTESLEETVQRMAQATGAQEYRVLPTIRFFKIGVNFDMVQERGAAHQYYVPSQWDQPEPLTELEVQAVREFQEDLPLVLRPFDGMARRLGITLQELFDLARDFQRRGVMRRYSAVLHHRRAGFKFNAMGVWKVPPERSEEVGGVMATHSAVTHCYERPISPDFPYSHYTMLHATTRQGCVEAAREISEQTGITDYQLLYSTREYKKMRVRYFIEG
ncbi:MAG: AsnC family transcriptional regulator [Dehalococcoidia bacterium]